MKVLKFGGTSVGSIESILSLKSIVETCNEPVVVVVSALGGITDKLIATSKLAASGNPSYKDMMCSIIERHHSLIDGIGLDIVTKQTLLFEVDSLLDELKSIYQGIYLIKNLPELVDNAIVSYGERISSKIVAALIKESVWYDALNMIKTENFGRKCHLNSELTEQYIQSSFFNAKDSLTDSNSKYVAVVPGFISTDVKTGEITNLGRGGSDYTAALIAAALNANTLEIWTDVDGFMTADPRVIKTAYKINSLSYFEAMELCNFGAKVIYPPTLYPVCEKDIPIIIKNTFNPSNPGTIIQRKADDGGHWIKGISSINDTSLITIAGPFMVGVAGVSSRVFSALASEHINVIFISQASSEISISVGVRKEDGLLAQQVLTKVFEKEIKMGSMFPVHLEEELATVAVVGENMKHNPGVAGKLFSVLGRNGISIKACAQGASETNISFVVSNKFLRKSLNVIHDNFFLSEFKELNLFICGIGTVGSNLIEQIRTQKEKLKKENGLKINVVGVARSNRGIFTRDGVNLDTYKTDLESGISLTIDKLREEVIGMNIFNSVFVDCTASADVASIYKDLFDHGINVVAANKIAASSDYNNYALLKALAKKRNVKYLFETNVGAGLPIINTINALKNSGDKILKIEAVVSGTLNFIFNTISKDIPFSQTVRMAKEQGYSEPDPRLDLCGKDVIRKLVILARESGYKVNQEDVEANLFIPQDFFDCSLDEFWKKLPSLDAEFEKERIRLEKEEKCWRFVAKMEAGKYSVSLREIERDHSFYVLDGTNNIILLTTERYKNDPMLIQGYGAGASVTAAGVFADIMSIANI